MPLTNVEIQNADATAKAIKLFDGRGLYLEVSPRGGRWWRLKYRFQGREKRLALGVYPEVSLKEARARCDEARKQILDGKDPALLRRLEKERLNGPTFETIAREWHEKHRHLWKPEYAELVLHRLVTNAFPWLGERRLLDISPRELLLVLRRIEARGAVETAHRILQYSGQILRYGIATGRAERDITSDLRGALRAIKERHHASLTDPKEVGALFSAIQAYKGSFVTRCALQLAALTFVRPGELRKAEWSEIDLDLAEWRIPAERMKMRAKHVVPLSTQAVGILRELQPATGRGVLVFPGTHDRKRPMSENTMNVALRRLGYGSEEMTSHGFRSMASTLLNELGWNRDAIERQLAHAERDSIRAAYNYAEHLPERKRMMQAWADHLEALAQSNLIDLVSGDS